MTARFVFLLVALVAIGLLALPGEPEAAQGDAREVNYLAVSVVMTVPTPSPTAVRVTMEISYYSCQELPPPCIAAYTGQRPTIGTAASSVLPAGTKLIIQDESYTVLDKCGACGESGLDLYVETRDEANRRGRREMLVTIEE